MKHIFTRFRLPLKFSDFAAKYLKVIPTLDFRVILS